MTKRIRCKEKGNKEKNLSVSFLSYFIADFLHFTEILNLTEPDFNAKLKCYHDSLESKSLASL